MFITCLYVKWKKMTINLLNIIQRADIGVNDIWKYDLIILFIICIAVKVYEWMR